MPLPIPPKKDGEGVQVGEGKTLSPVEEGGEGEKTSYRGGGHPGRGKKKGKRGSALSSLLTISERGDSSNYPPPSGDKMEMARRWTTSPVGGGRVQESSDKGKGASFTFGGGGGEILPHSKENGLPLWR